MRQLMGFALATAIVALSILLAAIFVDFSGQQLWACDLGLPWFCAVVPYVLRLLAAAAVIAGVATAITIYRDVRRDSQ